MINIGKSLKEYTADADKAVTPEKTLDRISKAFNRHGETILKELKRIDTGRLEIPVYFSYYGTRAREMGVPKRQQMGKGASAVQSQCSALMELAERYSYFGFVNNPDNFIRHTWKEARGRWSDKLISTKEIIKSVQEDISAEQAEKALDLINWRFTKATNIYSGQEEYVPLDWFKKLNEFNGSSAGNTFEESILQGVCELVERHTNAIVDQKRPVTPTIDPESIIDPILKELLARFTRKGIKVLLKDFTLGYPVPTIGAVVYDPQTFPQLSEIVFAAGTATTPDKAAIRTLTEVAQLAGDFHSGSNYEASGLPKFTSLNEIKWLSRGEVVSINSLPDLSHPDMGRELTDLCLGLAEMDYFLYSVSTMHPDLEIPTNYNFIPGFLFRERTPHASIGMVVGRILAEETDPCSARDKLEELSLIYPGAFFIPFFKGMVSIRMDKLDQALDFFTQAQNVQPDDESAALNAFYLAYTLTLKESWIEALPFLNKAVDLDPLVKEYFNLRGVAYYKQNSFDKAALDFQKALELDSGSATDMANLGLCYQKSGRKLAAAEMLTRALELDPTLYYAQKSLEEISL